MRLCRNQQVDTAEKTKARGQSTIDWDIGILGGWKKQGVMLVELNWMDAIKNKTERLGLFAENYAARTEYSVFPQQSPYALVTLLQYCIKSHTQQSL